MSKGNLPTKRADSSRDLNIWGFKSDQCDCCGLGFEDISGLLLQCGVCKQAYYCSQKCFNTDLERHRKRCSTGRMKSYTPDRSKSLDLPEMALSVIEKEDSSDFDKKQADPTGTFNRNEKQKNQTQKQKAIDKTQWSSVSKDTEALDEEEGALDPMLLTIACESASPHEIGKLLSRIPAGPMSLCRCGRDHIEKKNSFSCPNCEAQVTIANTNDHIERAVESLECSSCSYLFTVPRMQINDATDTEAPRKPTRSGLGKEYPLQKPMRCPECDYHLLVPGKTTEKADGAPKMPSRCPGCDFVLTTPRIQIQDDTHAQSPRKPRRSLDDPSLSPPRQPYRCPECDSCMDPSKNATKDGKPKLPKRCSDCDSEITVPSIQTNDCAVDRMPRKPFRDTTFDFYHIVAPSPDSAPPRRPSRCPECEAHVKWPTEAVDGEGHITKCTECETHIVVPRIQINDAADALAPKKPSRSGGSDSIVRSNCPDCDACIRAPSNIYHRDGVPKRPVRCPECDRMVTVPRIQINDASDVKAPKKPSRFSVEESIAVRSEIMPEKAKEVDSTPRLPARCEECQGFSEWPKSLLTDLKQFGSGLVGTTLCSSYVDSSVLNESLSMSEDDLLLDVRPSNRMNWYEINLRLTRTFTSKSPGSPVIGWTFALRKVDPCRFQLSGTYTACTGSMTTLSVDLRKSEIHKRDFFWEKPEWVTSRRLRKTNEGELIYSRGKLERDQKEIVSEKKAVLPEWLVRPALRKTASSVILSEI